MQTSFISLPSKPNARISYTYIPKKSTNDEMLIVFLNGLGLPASMWQGTYFHLMTRPYHPAMLTYDRYGQGNSDHDPNDANTADPAFAHGCEEVIRDLHSLIAEVCELHQLSHDTGLPRIMFAASSLGCAIARLYVQKYSGRVSSILFLDSIIANSRDFVSMFPDPDADDFDKDSLPDGITEQDLRETRQKYAVVFHPQYGTMGNGEGLHRRDLADLLPFDDRPSLQDVKITVAGHDFKKFAEDSFNGVMKTPIAITENFSNPYWHRYNQGLARLSGSSKGPIQAEYCGHFIPRDNPLFVAEEIMELLERPDVGDD